MTTETKGAAKKATKKTGVRVRAKESEELEREMNHIPDRDQMMDDGSRSFPPQSQMLEYTRWGGDDESDRNSRLSNSEDADTLEEYKRTEENLHELPNPIRAREYQPPVPPVDGNDLTEDKTDEELLAEASVLGIAGRGSMNRFQLSQAVKAATESMI